MNCCLCSREGYVGMNENCALKMRNFRNSKKVNAQVEQYNRNRTCPNRNQKEFLPRYPTHSCQSLDLFIIQKLSRVWRREREQKKISLILSKNYNDGLRHLKNYNPEKSYFMNLEVNCVSEVNAVVDHNEILLARKASLRCGLALNTSSCWEIAQLFQHLLEMIQRSTMELTGSSVQ